MLVEGIPSIKIPLLAFWVKIFLEQNDDVLCETNRQDFFSSFVKVAADIRKTSFLLSLYWSL